MRITKTKMTRPPRLCVYGPHGIGKSTFGASCPKPIFVPTEDGLEGMEVDSFELSTTAANFTEKLYYLLESEHKYRTVVIDSLDWLQKLIFDQVCEQSGVTDIAALPYGRGYVMAGNIWSTILDALKRLNEEKRMLIVLLAHAKIEKFEDPERENYDRYNLDLQRAAAGMVSEWVDILGFAQYKIATVKNDKGFGQASVKAKSTGERLLNLTEKPAFTAKNRYGLPDSVALDWEPFNEHFKAKMTQPNLAETKKEVKAAKVNKELLAKAEALKQELQ